MRTSTNRRRSGYALLLVMGFLTVLMAVWAVAYRSVGAALKVEMARTLRRVRDDGTMTALGRGVSLLQTGTPKNADGSDLTSSETYICYVQLNTNPGGPRWFCVVYAPQTISGNWTVRAFAVDNAGLPLMPQTFKTPPTSP